MPRPKKSPATAAPAAVPPSKTSHLFGARKAGDRSVMTHEALAADLEAFRKSGGKIEVLGTTQALRRIGQDAAPPTAAATDAPPKRRR